jgi:nucleoside-diphosphate-sugar epimerase
LTRSILAAAESSGAKLVFADNLYAYGPVDGPLREDLPALARGRKGRVRAGMAAELLGAQRDGRARVAIGRASDYYGPRGTGSTAGETVFGRILAGKKPLWTGRLDQPHTFHFLPDIARGLLVLADHREADGQVWHLPAADPLSAQQFFDMIADAAGRPVPVRASVAAPALLAVAGMFSPLLREMRETTYQFRAPFVIDSSKFDAAFGRLGPTPHRDAVEQTVAWYRSGLPAPAMRGRPTDSAPSRRWHGVAERHAGTVNASFLGRPDPEQRHKRAPDQRRSLLSPAGLPRGGTVDRELGDPRHLQGPRIGRGRSHSGGDPVR